MSGKPTVLVVDDPAAPGAVAERVERAGIDVETATDVEAATAALTDADFDCAVRVGATDGGFFVEDDGAGLPDESDADLFQSGYTTADDGTGFGLAIVRSIAEAHDWGVATGESGSEGAAASEASGGSPARSADGARFEFTGVASPGDDGRADSGSVVPRSESVARAPEEDARGESGYQEPGVATSDGGGRSDE